MLGVTVKSLGNLGSPGEEKERLQSKGLQKKQDLSLE